MALEFCKFSLSFQRDLNFENQTIFGRVRHIEINQYNFDNFFTLFLVKIIECLSTQSSVTILGNEKLGHNYDSNDFSKIHLRLHVCNFFKVPRALIPKSYFRFLGANPIQNKPFDPSHGFLKANLAQIEGTV